MKKLIYPDVAAIAISWLGGTSITLISNDAFVALIVVIACYYITKFIIFKKE